MLRRTCACVRATTTRRRRQQQVAVLALHVLLSQALGAWRRGVALARATERLAYGWARWNAARGRKKRHCRADVRSLLFL